METTCSGETVYEFSSANITSSQAISIAMQILRHIFEADDEAGTNKHKNFQPVHFTGLNQNNTNITNKNICFSICFTEVLQDTTLFTNSPKQTKRRLGRILKALKTSSTWDSLLWEVEITYFTSCFSDRQKRRNKSRRRDFFFKFFFFHFFAW